MHSIKGLYLNNQTLVSVGNSSTYEIQPFMDIWHPDDQKVTIASYQVSMPQAPHLQQSIVFDGYLIASRRIENKLHLVSSYSPTVEGINYGATTDAEKQANYDKIQSTNIQQLMPKLKIENSTC